MPKKQGFRAQLYLLTTENGGRKEPIFTGYRPLLDFGTTHEGRKSYNSCILNLRGVGKVLPGESFEADIYPLRPELLAGQITAHQCFEITEGKRVVGKGEVIAPL